MSDGLFRRASPLFPARAARRRSDDFLTRELALANERIAQGAVTPTFDPVLFRKELSSFDFEIPCSLDELLAWTIRQMELGVVHMTHPRYFGLFNPAPSFPAQCADRIAAAFNPQLAMATTSPAAVAIERHVIQSIAQRVGLPVEATGHFTTGGSEANYTALICALTHSNPKFAVEGARAFQGSPVFYTSKESHLAWIKIAHQTGIGRSAVRLVSTDGSGRMDPGALIEAMRADLAKGNSPCMVVATAGTTNAGMIDPLAACAQIARSFNAWYHIDAAWGGALIASDRLRGALAGIEHADSLTIDAHKWFATTMGCGMFISRHAALLASTFGVSTSYMPSNDPNADPYVTSVQWSRRFVGLRLFLSLATAGWRGHAKHVEQSIELIELLKQRLAALGWAAVNDSPLAVLCLEPPPEFAGVATIVRRVLASGRAWISSANFEGRDIIRACVTHGETTPHDIAQLVDALHNSGHPSGNMR